MIDSLTFNTDQKRDTSDKTLNKKELKKLQRENPLKGRLWPAGDSQDWKNKPEGAVQLIGTNLIVRSREFFPSRSVAFKRTV